MVGEFHVTYWPIEKSTRYRVDHEGDTIVDSCVEPITAGARALLELGVDPDDKIVTINGPLNMRCMSCSIAHAVSMGD